MVVDVWLGWECFRDPCKQINGMSTEARRGRGASTTTQSEKLLGDRRSGTQDAGRLNEQELFCSFGAGVRQIYTSNASYHVFIFCLGWSSIPVFIFCLG